MAVRASPKSVTGALVAFDPDRHVPHCVRVSEYDGILSRQPKDHPPTSPQALAMVVQATARTMTLTSQFEMTFRQASSDASATPLGAHGAVDFRGPSATNHINFVRGSGAESMVFLPGTVFFKPPPSTPPLQPGKPWVFANFADIAKYKVNFPPVHRADGEYQSEPSRSTNWRGGRWRLPRRDTFHLWGVRPLPTS